MTSSSHMYFKSHSHFQRSYDLNYTKKRRSRHLNSHKDEGPIKRVNSCMFAAQKEVGRLNFCANDERKTYHRLFKGGCFSSECMSCKLAIQSQGEKRGHWEVFTAQPSSRHCVQSNQTWFQCAASRCTENALQSHIDLLCWLKQQRSYEGTVGCGH